MTDKKKGRREGTMDPTGTGKEKMGLKEGGKWKRPRDKGWGVISLFARMCRAGDSERQQKPLVIIILNKEGDPVGPRTLLRAAHPRLVF